MTQNSTPLMDPTYPCLRAAAVREAAASRTATTSAEQRQPRSAPPPSLSDELDQARRALRALQRTARRLQQQNETLIQGLESAHAANTALENLARRDALTGLPNYRALDERLREECERAREHATPLCIALVDFDNFRHYNNTWGHPAANDVLRTIAQRLERNLEHHSCSSGSSFVARFGGEEFVVVLPLTDGETATAVAERLRVTIAKGPWPARRPVTASFGVARLSDTMAGREDLLSEADRALRHAKQTGKNRVVYAGDIPLIELSHQRGKI